MPVALLSVFDKTGVVKLAKALDDLGWDLLSSGGTAGAIRAAHVPVTDTSEHTGFPVIMDHRVATLHPKIHGGILADRDKPKHMQEARDHGIDLIDLVVCNFYDFGKDPGVEKIDIGGPAMVRAAAKNFAFTGAVIDPADYSRVVAAIKHNDGVLPQQLRKELAIKAFELTSKYDAEVAAWLAA